MAGEELQGQVEARYIEDMVKGLMPKFEFQGEAAKFVGRVGKQELNALPCKCCGRGERKKTLICDACGNSFHLKCLKLRSAVALLLDRWLCKDCSAAADGGHPLNSSCDKRSALRSSSRVLKHPDSDNQQIPHHEIGKLRFVLKLKTAHFKGSRALADDVIEIPSDRSTEESTEQYCARRPSCQMDCVSYAPQSELASLPIICSQDVSKELIRYNRACSKKAMVAESVMEESTEQYYAGRPSCQMDCVSYAPQLQLASPPIICSQDISKELIGYSRACNKKAKLVAESVIASQSNIHNPLNAAPHLRSLELQQAVSNLNFCGDRSRELNHAGAKEMSNEEAKSADNSCSRNDGGLILPNSQIQCLSLTLVHGQGDSDIHLLETATDEEVAVPRKDEAIDIRDLALKKINEGASELAIEQVPQLSLAEDCPKQDQGTCMNGTRSEKDLESSIRESSNKVASLVKTRHVPTTYVKKRAAPAEKRPKLNVCVCTHERDEMCVQERRRLVEVVDDVQKGPWYQDAVDLMGLEPLACIGKHGMNGYEVNMLSSKPHSQLHVNLNTWCLLQVYADCRERCIIVYDLGKAKRDDAEVSQKTIDVDRIWSVGGGFYVLLLGSKEAVNESVCCRIIPFQGGIGYAIPYVPNFPPMQELEGTCPVWVTFVHLPIYFHPFLKDLAMPLGKLLYVPRSEAGKSSDSPRVCVCWNVSRSIPEFLYVDMDGLGSKKLKIEFDSCLLRNLSKLSSQGKTSLGEG